MAKRKSEIIVVMLFVLLLISSCSDSNSQSENDKYRDYYVGYDGVSMKLPRGAIPDRIYYYSGETNEIPIQLEISNKGASDSYGGVYLSGYDPGMFEEQQTFLDREAGVDCGITGFLINDGGWLSSFACRLGNLVTGSGTVGGDGIQHFSGQVNAGELLDIFGATDYFTKDGRELIVDIDYDDATGETSFGMEMMTDWITSGYYNHGRGAIVYFAAMFRNGIGRNFISDKHGGREFTNKILLGDRPSYPGGGEDYLNFLLKIKSWPTGLDEMPQVFQFTSCYIYTTYADPMVCVDPFPDGPGRKVCTPKTQTFSKGQGAPIALTKVEQETTPKEIFFTFYFENKGDGVVWSPWSLQKCDPYYGEERVKATDTNRILIGDVRFSRDVRQLDCIPENRIVRLDESGKGMIRCSYDLDYITRDAYLAPLIIEAWYGYSEVIQARTNIRRVR
ncbi:hypothetical protein JW868_01310 [Candidatus Woesearchaeota archaeon]|nr:hypothetical protein [Candidatus Woesearchaeota archaeon]